MTIRLTRAQLEAARANLSAQGLTLVGDNGEVSKHGVTLDFSYVEADETLTVTTKSKPFFVSESEIEKEVTAWFGTDHQGIA